MPSAKARTKPKTIHGKPFDGCGAWKGDFIPDIFPTACYNHDKAYYERQNRFVADHQFLVDMIAEAKKKKWSWWYKFLAWIYFLGVRLFGWMFY